MEGFSPGVGREDDQTTSRLLYKSIFYKFLLPHENPNIRQLFARQPTNYVVTPASYIIKLSLLLIHCKSTIIGVGANNTKHGCEVGRVAQNGHFLAETPFSAVLCQALDQLDPWRTSPPAETTLLFTPSTFLQ